MGCSVGLGPIFNLGKRVDVRVDRVGIRKPSGKNQRKRLPDCDRHPAELEAAMYSSNFQNFTTHQYLHAKIGLNLAVRGIYCQILDFLLATTIRRIQILSELSANQGCGTFGLLRSNIA